MRGARQITIEKPVKVLREDLQKRKVVLEKKGWKFAQNANSLWKAEKYFSKEDSATEFNNKMITELLEAAESAEFQHARKPILKQASRKPFSPKPQTAEKIIVEVDKTALEKFAETNSCNTIGEKGNKIRKPFEHNGKLYVATSSVSSHKTGYTEVEAFEAVPESEFEGETYSYDEKRSLIKTDEDRKTFYHGVRVKQGGNSFVLQSPKIKFVPAIISKKQEGEPLTATLQTISADTVISLNIGQIVPSPFEPQARRRARFKDVGIESLGNSIAEHGLAQPILVRPTGKTYEIVFGERRFLAVKHKGVAQINCFVRVLTDSQVLELQYEENHRRMDNDPLDDAFFFKFLKEKENYSIEELASRLNTTPANVQNKLILNDLISEAQKELSDGLLPLKHAYFLARFPVETQKLICKEQYAYKGYDRDEGAASYKSFVEEIQENIERKLENAPFSTIDPRLHIKGLICPDCTQRTGYAPSLFTDLTKDDSCLNKSCFEMKTNVHLRLKRDEIALQRPNPTNIPVEEIVREVPLVTDRVWTDKKILGEKPLVNQKFLPEKECEFSTLSLIVEGTRKGEETYICTEKACTVHNPQMPPPDLTDEKFVRQVELLAREKVLAKSIEFFSDYKPIWLYNDLIQKLILELWENTISDTREVILRVIKDWKNLPKNSYTGDEINRFISSLDKTKQSQLIFLLIFHAEGFYKNSNQDGIKKLATDYARVDYRLVEAEARLELAPESEKDLAKDILTMRRAGIRDLQKPEDLGDAAH